MIAIKNHKMPQCCNECRAHQFRNKELVLNNEGLTAKLESVCALNKRRVPDPEVIPVGCPLVEIVTCGECRFNKTTKCIRSEYDDSRGEYRIADNDPDDFCNYGKTNQYSLDYVYGMLKQELDRMIENLEDRCMIPFDEPKLIGIICLLEELKARREVEGFEEDI